MRNCGTYIYQMRTDPDPYNTRIVSININLWFIMKPFLQACFSAIVNNASINYFQTDLVKYSLGKILFDQKVDLKGENVNTCLMHCHIENVTRKWTYV